MGPATDKQVINPYKSFTSLNRITFIFSSYLFVCFCFVSVLMGEVFGVVRACVLLVLLLFLLLLCFDLVVYSFPLSFSLSSVIEFVYKLINTYDIFFKLITKENVYSSDYG